MHGLASLTVKEPNYAILIDHVDHMAGDSTPPVPEGRAANHPLSDVTLIPPKD